MNESTLIWLVLGDLVIGFLIWLYLRDYFAKFKWWRSAILKGLVYSLFFGIGLLGEGGGDPGFLLPVPILPGAIVTLSESKFHLFVRNALIPYVFWTKSFFLFMLYDGACDFW